MPGMGTAKGTNGHYISSTQDPGDPLHSTRRSDDRGSAAQPAPGSHVARPPGADPGGPRPVRGQSTQSSLRGRTGRLIVTICDAWLAVARGSTQSPGGPIGRTHARPTASPRAGPLLAFSRRIGEGPRQGRDARKYPAIGARASSRPGSQHGDLGELLRRAIAGLDQPADVTQASQ